MGVATKAARKTAKKKGSKRSDGVRFVFNAKGEKTEVLLPIALYRRMLEEIEDAEDIRAADEAMKEGKFVPWEEAERQLDALRD